MPGDACTLCVNFWVCWRGAAPPKPETIGAPQRNLRPQDTFWPSSEGASTEGMLSKVVPGQPKVHNKRRMGAGASPAAPPHSPTKILVADSRGDSCEPRLHRAGSTKCQIFNMIEKTQGFCFMAICIGIIKQARCASISHFLQ